MKLFLIRHGQTLANVERIYAGQSDVPLTEQGRQEAEHIRPILEKISFDRVYSSDLSRAVDTQRIALPGHTAEQTPLLREFDMGRLTGLRYVNAAAEGEESRTGTKLTHENCGAETSDMVCARIRRFLDVLEAEPCHCAAAFVHNGVMNCMLQLVLKADFDRSAVFSRNCAINVFEYDGKRWRLLAWNYMGNI